MVYAMAEKTRYCSQAIDFRKTWDTIDNPFKYILQDNLKMCIWSSAYGKIINDRSIIIKD